MTTDETHGPAAGWADDTPYILDCIHAGTRIRPGTWCINPITAIDVPDIEGSGEAATVLVMRPGWDTHTAIKLWSHPSEQGHDGLTGIPRGGRIAGLTIASRLAERHTGIWMHGARLSTDRVRVSSCRFGYWSNWLVDSEITRPVVSNCDFGIVLQQTITTLAIRGGNIRQCVERGLMIYAGVGITVDRTIFESHQGLAVQVMPWAQTVDFNHPYFENNPNGAIAHSGNVRIDGIEHSYRSLGPERAVVQDNGLQVVASIDMPTQQGSAWRPL